MNEYLVVKILDRQSIALPSTSVYGLVELRSYRSDSEQESEVLKRSASLSKLDFDKYMYCARISTIVQADNINDASDTADNLFSDILDLKSVEFAISNINTSDIGFVKDLNSGEIYPTTTQELHSSMMFMMHQGDIQQFDAVNHIISLKNELSIRYQRSLHWVRKSKHENNKQLKALFYWFSIEALIKESETDNVGPVIRWFLGFPNGVNRKNISAQRLNELASHSKYGHWDKELIKIIDKIRIFRNHSVHSGFRYVDFSKKELELYNQVMIFSASRCQAAVQHALLNGISTVSDFKECIWVVFEEINSVTDVHGNILHSLERIESI